MEKDNKNSNYSVLESMENFVAQKYSEMSAQNKKTVFISSIVMSVLLVAASQVAYMLGLPELIGIFIGAPAGVIVFFILFVKLELERSIVSNLKEKNSVRMRWNKLIKYWAFFIPFLLLLSIFNIQPLGGALLIGAFLMSVSFIRKSEEEIFYTDNGEVDPRDLEQE
jgi:hypothetical protein